MQHQQLRPIFVGGQRRSGTTLMRTILCRHAHIARIPESHFFQDERFELFFRSLLEHNETFFKRIGVGPPEMDSAMAAFIAALFEAQRIRKGANRWLEKSPENILRIDYLLRLFPNAQFIHMIRDPRDTLCSMKQQAATYKPKWAKFTAEVTAPEWVRAIQTGIPWRQCTDRYVEVHYEDLVRKPESVMRRVLSFLGEPWCPSLLDASGENQQVTKGGNDHLPIFPTSVGRWVHDLSQDEIQCIESIAGETMASLGYSVTAGQNASRG